jgi:SAM-dependent methyltransferase
MSTVGMLYRTLGRLWRRLRPQADSVVSSGSVIPAPDRRWCGPEFKDDDFYIHSAECEAIRLRDRMNCTRQSRVLDVGCGQGRLAIGIQRIIGELDYVGLDVDRGSIDWCKRHIESAHPTFRFAVCNVANERYNPDGVRLDQHFLFDVASGSRDIIYLYSVFSHTTEHDMRVYLREFARILAPGGGLVFTTFVEEGVESVAINPPNYRLACAGPLHVVRYDRQYLFSLVEEEGFLVQDFAYGRDSDGQSSIYLAASPTTRMNRSGNQAAEL